jgi:hypothetical protein
MLLYLILEQCIYHLEKDLSGNYSITINYPVISGEKGKYSYVSPGNI